MTFLASQPVEERQQLQTLQQTPGDPDGFKPGFFQGSADATGVAFGRVLGVANQLAGELEYQAGAIFTRPIDQLFDTDWTNSLNEVMREKPAQFTAAMTPDPMTTGSLGRILYGVVGVGLPAVGGAYLGGPVGAAAAAGSFQTVGSYTDLTAQGVDPNTAASAALFEGGMTAAGVGLPAAIGGRVALSTLLYGPGINVAQDVLTGQGTAALLESQGYHELADRYAHIDAEMIAADIVLGAAFGYGGARAARVKPQTGDIDAALTATAQKHVEVDTAPGIPADYAAVQIHTQNLQRATEALLDGRPVDAEQGRGTFVPKPENPLYGDDQLLAAFRASELPGLLDEIGALEVELAKRGRALDDEALPDLPAPAERRADSNELARLGELRAARAGRRLSIDEADELLTLETRDRLAAKVAGRRIPGVLNMEARNEAEAAGRLLPVQAFADADNFKSVNDELGHDVGDHVISQIGRLFAEALGEGNVFHRGGDEFVMQAHTSGELRKAMESVRATLEGAELVATRADGTTVSRRGVRFSYGEGKTIQEAEHAQYADKDARKAAGLRTDRADAGKAPDSGRTGESLGDTARGEDRPGGAPDPAEVLTERLATEIVEDNPKLTLPDGKAVDELAAADDAIARAEQDAAGFEAAVACFLRSGA